MSNKLPLSQIRPNDVALRAVDTESEAFLAMVESVKQVGILNAINVREAVDPETGENFFEVVDGLHRYTSAIEAGLTEIPATVIDLEEDQLLEAQMIANMHKIETKPAEYSKQLQRILGKNPMMTESELARRLSKSPQWLRERLNLNKIGNPKIIELVNDGQIGLTNAYALAKLPEEEQSQWVDRAMTQAPDEFVPAATARKKEIADANRKGKEASVREFQPNPHLQKMGIIKEELETGRVGRALIEKFQPKNAIEAFALAIKWTLHMDDASIAEAKAAWEEKEREREAAKKRREAEAAEKKAKEQSAKAAEAAAEAEEKKAAVAS